MQSKIDHWMKGCLKCGSPTSKNICRPCFDFVKTQPEISGFLDSEEQAFIEVKDGFLAFYCNNSWILPKVKVKLEYSNLEPTTSINCFFREYFNIELKYIQKYRLCTKKDKDIVRNTYYIDCRNIEEVQNKFLSFNENPMFKYYNITLVGILRKEGDYIIPNGYKKIHMNNDIFIDDSIYNVFDIRKQLMPRIVIKNYNINRYNKLYKMLKYRMHMVIHNLRFDSWNIRQILHYTDILWKYKNSDPCEKHYQIITVDIIKKSDILSYRK